MRAKMLWEVEDATVMMQFGIAGCQLSSYTGLCSFSNMVCDSSCCPRGMAKALVSRPLVQSPCRTLPKLKPMSDVFASAASTGMDVDDDTNAFATMLCICQHPHLYTKLKSHPPLLPAVCQVLQRPSLPY
ncbi:hypothetical protein TSMEX_002364 [Taenia solium]|eukprot:TsM_000358500 transcript=TsM_000358500 gene=TsM_000358500